VPAGRVAWLIEQLRQFRPVALAAGVLGRPATPRRRCTGAPPPDVERVGVGAADRVRTCELHRSRPAGAARCGQSTEGVSVGRELVALATPRSLAWVKAVS
jgi:hypothetical protein